MAGQDLSTSQLPSLPLPAQGSDLIHVVRSGVDYKATRTNLLQQFLSGLQDVSLASLQAGHILIYNAVSGKWENSTLSWGSILSKPSVFPPATHVHSWSDLVDAPLSFPPSAHTHAWGDLTGIPATFTPSPHNHDDRYFTESELSISGGGGAVHWNNITNVPPMGGGSGDMLKATYDPDLDGIVDVAESAPWAGITDKPATFTPSAHSHPWADLTGIPEGMLINYKGGVLTSAGQNYPAGVVGDLRDCTDDGYIGGLPPAGYAVHWGDFILCIADNAGGTEAEVGASWLHISGAIGSIKLHNNQRGAQGALVQFYGANTVVSAECGITGDPTFPNDHRQDVPTQSAVMSWVAAQLAALPPSSGSWGDILDKPATFPPDVHSHLWADITDKPTTFTPSAHTHLWADTTDKPATFAPSAHSHLWADLTDKPTTFTPETHTHDDRYYTETELGTSGAGGAVHWDNVTSKPGLISTGPGEIVALPSIAPVDLTAFVVEDTDDGNKKKRVIFANILSAVATYMAPLIALVINTLTDKVTPVDADVLLIEDSATSFTRKKLTWAHIKATLKSYFDTVYAAVGTIPICLQAGAASFNPADSTTYYFGSMPNEAPTATDARYRVYIPMTGTVARVYVFWEEWGGVAGTAEAITANFHYDGTTNTLIQTVSNANAAKVFQNTALNIAVGAGHYFEIELVCPAWATNPTLVRLSAVVYMY